MLSATIRIIALIGHNSLNKVLSWQIAWMLILFLWLLLCLEEFAPIIVEIQVEQICFGLWESLTFRMIYQCHTDIFYKSCAWLKLVEKIARLQKHKISRLLRTWPLIPTHLALRTFSTRSKKLLLTFEFPCCVTSKKRKGKWKIIAYKIRSLDLLGKTNLMT